MIKVIFDTNSIRNNGGKTFFGSEIKKFILKCEIFIPSMVIDEIKNQKFKELKSQKEKFLSSPFLDHYGVGECKTKKCNIEDIIKDLVKNDEIEYSIIDLKDNSKINDIKKLAIRNKPPFEEGSDKGFKDTYIYFTILEFLESIDDRIVYVITKDQRLKKALEENNRIKVIKDFDEFEKNNYIYFKQEYFLGILGESIGLTIGKNDISDVSFNINNNWLLIIEILSDKYIVEVDFISKEIICFTKKEDFENYIKLLINSGSFRNTHDCIDYLKGYINYLNNNEIEELLLALIDNDQISSILLDEDIKQFFTDLYTKSKVKLDENKDKEFCYYCGIKSKYI